MVYLRFMVSSAVATFSELIVSSIIYSELPSCFSFMYKLRI